MELSKLDLLILNSFIEYGMRFDSQTLNLVPSEITRRRDSQLILVDIRDYLSACCKKNWISKSWEQKIYNRINLMQTDGLLESVGEQCNNSKKVLRINQQHYDIISNRGISELVMIDGMKQVFNGEVYSGYIERLTRQKS